MIELQGTSGSAIAAAIAKERHRMGSPTTGMVLTLLICSDGSHSDAAAAAAARAARQHPMRILTLVTDPYTTDNRIDAEISVGGDQGPGELAIVHLLGSLSEHANSVVIPLLLSDTPVVAWWPGVAPDVTFDDPIGHHAQRRITDLSADRRPLEALRVRAAGYRPGDTDLAWARLTQWRSVLATMLDLPHGDVQRATVHVAADNPSGPLMAGWLLTSLEVPIELVISEGPGITEVSIETANGPLIVTRPDGVTATIQRPGMPDSHIPLPRRHLADLIAEELRRLDEDIVFARSLAAAVDFIGRT